MRPLINIEKYFFISENRSFLDSLNLTQLGQKIGSVRQKSQLAGFSVRVQVVKAKPWLPTLSEKEGLKLGLTAVRAYLSGKIPHLAMEAVNSKRKVGVTLAKVWANSAGNDCFGRLPSEWLWYCFQSPIDTFQIRLTWLNKGSSSGWHTWRSLTKWQFNPTIIIIGYLRNTKFDTLWLSQVNSLHT